MDATSVKPLLMRLAARQDAPRIAEIHMAAFGPNAMLRAQFPTPAVRQALQTSIENKALADIDDPKITVLVVTAGSDDSEKSLDNVISFAKWSHPVDPGEDYVEPPWIWPEGTDLDTLAAWTALAAEAESRAVGSIPCYRMFPHAKQRITTLLIQYEVVCWRTDEHLGLSFIGTDPSHGGRGAGSLLLHWGVQQSNKSGSPLYLESTEEAAAFYKKNGLIAGEVISLPIRVDGSSETQIYKEIVFTYHPTVE
ncbi:unnamed protein product [Clonostachys rhizophaga]|uniref:N-acetyltransferase domain-containing protein n=1 Tax=Clonostachys rhizophaga TaxID=160324 RepID=A0A9N9VPF4_9HYPO|nr:unnamed protein product [Clonostachys rhizophaga]